MDHNIIAVVTAEEAADRDRSAIAGGVPARSLMQNAGEAAATVILRRFPLVLETGAEIHVGPGNNGGDGWVVAAVLAGQGVGVKIVEAAPPKTADATNAKSSFRPESNSASMQETRVFIDALLGTGSRGSPEGRIADSVKVLNAAGERGATVVALDLPTGLDASTGDCKNSVRATHTLAFGSIKRGHLISRGLCGAIEVLDIGLRDHGRPRNSDVQLADSAWVARNLAPIPASAHKGTRKRLAIIAGGPGMAGAAILAAKAALRSGIGIVDLFVGEANRAAVHAAVPAALVRSHDEFFSQPDLLKSADAVVIGPGLDVDLARRALEALPSGDVPLLLDAGALGAFADDSEAIASIVKGRPAVLTPHPAEMGRILGVAVGVVLDSRFDVGSALARTTGATVLLKGTPTIASAPNGERMVTATGTPALATGGSGDMLTGIVGTLLAQTRDPLRSAVCGAWIHGRAAELCGPARGVTLEDILFAMPAAWRASSQYLRPPVITALPAIA